MELLSISNRIPFSLSLSVSPHVSPLCAYEQTQTNYTRTHMLVGISLHTYTYTDTQVK